MRLISLLSAGLILLLTACGEGNYDEAYYDEYGQGYDEGVYYEESMQEYQDADYSNQASNYNQQMNAPQMTDPQNSNVRIVPIKNAKTGMVSEYVPMPKNWKLVGNKWEGPEGSIMEMRMGGTFDLQQMPLYSADQVIQQDMAPKLKQGGVNIIRTFDVPKITQLDQMNGEQYWRYGNPRQRYEAKAIEIEIPTEGKKGLIIIHYTLSQSQFASMVSYYYHVLISNPNRFEQDKKDILYAVENTKVNPQAIAAHNQREQARSQQSAAAHNQRMAANQQNFNAMQNIQKQNSSVGDIMFEGYMNRSRMSDRMHDKTIDGIWERQAGVNPYSGNQVKVDAGYKYYYMNQFGQYIGTNDANYNPAMDPNLNNQQWQQIQFPNGGY